MANQSGLERVLQRSFDSFLHTPLWLVLSTVHGEYLGHWLQSDITCDIERCIALSNTALAHHHRHAYEHGVGNLRYGLTLGDDGFVIDVLIANVWVVSIRFAESSLTVLANTLQALPDVVEMLERLTVQAD